MNAWRYERASDIDQPVIERLRRFPREPDMLVYGLAQGPRFYAAPGCACITGYRSPGTKTCRRRARS